MGGVVTQIESENGITINRRTFETALYEVRKERRRGKWIAQSTTPTRSPLPQTELKAAQPVIEFLSDDGTPSQAPGEVEEQAVEAAYTPWKRERKINPLLLELKAKQDRGEI